MAPGGSFGSISVKLSLPIFKFSIGDKNHNVQNPFVWLSISVSKNTVGAFKKSDERILNALNTGKENYLAITGAKISNWTKKGKDGGEDTQQFKLEASSGSVSVGNKTFGSVNKCTFVGKVLSYEPTGKMMLGCSYMSPKENEWKTREIPVIVSQAYDPTLLNRKIMIFGQVCNITPTGETKLYVVSTQIYKL